ncbi:MAG: LysM peptidoglycan-binding domain-containing protein [Cardiobacteriaceae bacterium]|nr:LysM peptidoglycan-binding domain-containing protein [Cardiobacteriaceae bacterium]
MFKSQLKGLGLALAVVFAGCTSPRDPFLNQQERPTELCLNDGSYIKPLANTDEAFQQQYPMRYVVKKGDTLWGISKRFLVLPWYWTNIWYDNPQIRNPHLIYPGDVLSVVSINGSKRITITESDNEYHGTNTGRTTKDGLPIVRYSPHMRVDNFGSRPVSIAADVVHAHALKTRILRPNEIQNLPFILGDAGDYLTLTEEQEIYAKGMNNAQQGQSYGIFRPVGDPIVDLGKYGKGHNKKAPALGYEMRFIGEAGVIGYDVASDLTKLHIQEAVEPVHEEDVILPLNAHEDPVNYFPKIPSGQCSRGYIIRTSNIYPTIKEFDTVITSFGKDNGAEVGDIWKIVREGPGRIIKGQPVQIPGREIGYLMIIRVYDDVSIGFVLDSTQSIYETDSLVRP